MEGLDDAWALRLSTREVDNSELFIGLKFDKIRTKLHS
jgi:hypothetical protein